MGGGLPDVHRLAEKVTPTDSSVSNGSTIALLLDYADRRCLLGGDAHPDVLIAGIEQLCGVGGVLEVDVFKLPHHGSKANVTRDLLARVRAHTYVFSTDGSGSQRHPDDESVARVITYGGQKPLLAFNYRSARNEVWDNPLLKAQYGYRTKYPSPGTSGIEIDLIADEGD